MEYADRKIPVILDTDIGSDIDDVWALVMMLNSPELDIRLILTANGNTIYRAKIVAKLLEAAGRTDIPIGIGHQTSDKVEAQGPWVENYRLEDYAGIVHFDGISALINEITRSEEQITLIAIGPLTNIACALDKKPEIARKARFVGMHGSIRKGYGGADALAAEYNVRVDAAACRKVFAAPWEVTVTPLDTCGSILLKGEKYMKVHNSQNALVKALMENYRIWDSACSGNNLSQGYGVKSTILFDTVAVYLSFCEELLIIEEIGVRVTDDGYTLIDESNRKIRCATAWRDVGAFEDMLVERLLGIPELPVRLTRGEACVYEP